VDVLDLEVRSGEIFGLLGQNGAGKTTTILMLLGLTEPSGGTARVVGLDPARRPLEVKRRVGYLPDAVGFYGNLTGRENLRYTGRLNGLGADEIEQQIAHVLEQVGLVGRADTPTDTYSRGMLQRLGIADALLKDPDVLILDEPTTSIDPIGVVEFGDGAAHLEVTVASDEAGASGPDPRATLAAIEGVSSVEWDVPAAAWHISVRPMEASGMVREAILRAAVERGLRLTSLRVLEPSLDDIYRTAVAGMSRAGVTTEVGA